ncbi:MAG: phenylalanine--tRNA ligase subunit beta [Johnsonella sp.]|nr:phenylalanine--tRNA ligase subunit beta [Johnsonella sp.]
MKTALSWIGEYLPKLDLTRIKEQACGEEASRKQKREEKEAREITLDEYCDRMTLTGTKVEGYEERDKNLEKIVIGRIESIEKHPDADKLIICRCDVGDRKVQIVTGAHNVSEGDSVPIVLDGGRVAGGHEGGALPPDGIRIKKGKLRGVESEGMMCSVEELGLDRNYYPDAPENGIYILGEDAKPGESALEYLGLEDAVVEYEITSNRADCNSVIGIAREAAAAFGTEFALKAPISTGNGENIEDYLKVEIRDPDLCRRYIARMVRNIRIAPSPRWMRNRLAAHGIRPINNIVDITNYVMLEYGQPMHSFDYEMIEGRQIIVKRAKEGDRFQTLDGQERELDAEILMINDAKRAVALAGIMGGENSKIREEVKTMVFECANFEGTNIRISSKKLGLRTDSSSKFEKDLCPETAMKAMERACELVEELGAGEVIGGCIDVYPCKQEERRIAFEPEAIRNLLGLKKEGSCAALSDQEMLAYLDSVEIKYDESKNELIAPAFRSDLSCMADIAEEVARLYGYDRIPTALPTGEATMGGISFEKRIRDIARRSAEFMGYSEAMTYSFESPKVFAKLNLSEHAGERKVIGIMNPLGEDFSIMRTNPLNGILNSLSLNYNMRNKDVKLYEFANIYLPKELPLKELPQERMQLVLAFYGEGDFFTLKGGVEEILDNLGICGKKHYHPDTERPYLHPGRKAEISYEGVSLGYLGELHPKVAKNYKLEARTYIAVLDMQELGSFASFQIKYRGIARYPAMTRDISLVVPKAVLAGEIEEVIEKHHSGILESYKLFDIYEGDQIAEGFKSLAYTITFRHGERTLEEKEVAAVMEKILGALGEKGIRLRA